MNEAEELVERYVAVWNETDPQRCRETILRSGRPRASTAWEHAKAWATMQFIVG
jgi:hypothetical protein